QAESGGNDGPEESVESQHRLPLFPQFLGNPVGIPTFPPLRLRRVYIKDKKPGEGCNSYSEINYLGWAKIKYRSGPKVVAKCIPPPPWFNMVLSDPPLRSLTVSPEGARLIGAEAGTAPWSGLW